MKTLYKTQIRIILVFFITFGLYAQTPGSVDTSFDTGTGFNNGVWTFALQPDGKILAGGYFTEYNGTTQNHITRLNTDGTLDTSFDTFFEVGSGGSSPIRAIASQPDGKILVGGEFGQYNGVIQNRLVRLNSDGSWDTSFDTGTGFSGLFGGGSVRTIVLPPDGKILAGGDFTGYKGITQNRIVRLNSNGNLDTSFTVGTGFDSSVETIILQSDGKILVAGSFTEYNGTARNRIARLNSNGSLDTSFTIGTGFNNGVQTIALQSDGKILVGGNFTEYNGTTQNYIARLNANGSLDNSFTIGTGFNSQVYSIAIQSDGKILAGGLFTNYNGTIRNFIIRLNTDGSLDNSFIIGGGFSSFLFSVALQSDGKILAGGGALSYNGVSINRIARLHGDTTAGIEELKPVTVNTYPNPTTDYFNITSEAMIQSVELYDVSGRLVRTSLVNGFETQQNVSNLTNGVYILKIKTQEGEITGKIIKK